MNSQHSVPLPVGTTGTAAPLLVLFYGISGFTSLAFEVLWARMLSVQFGVSIFGVVVTVTAFMLGLGIGSLLGNLWARSTRRALHGYALLEGAVALYALALPWVLGHVDAWLNATAPGAGLAWWYACQVSALLGLLLVPALAMGAAFPLMLRAGCGAGVSLGNLYGINACGGALGALFTLWLMPLQGWSGAVWTVAFVALFVSLAAFWLAVSRPFPECAAGAVSTGGMKPQRLTLLAYAGVGASAIMLEIGWTRLYGMIMLRTEYVMAIILAVYLVGIGAGSLLAQRLRAAAWYSVFACLSAVCGIATIWALPHVSAWQEQSGFASLNSALLIQGGFLAMLTLPATLVLGAWLPLLTRRLGDHLQYGVWLYGINSTGAALGAMLAGFVLIPLVGTPATVVLASLLLFIFGMAWVRSRKVWVVLPFLVLLAWPVAQMSPVTELLPRAQAGSRDLYRYEDALAITHVVEQANGQRLLLTDLQRMDASTDPTAVELQKNQARLPLMFHAGTRSVLFLGLGTGITASGSLPYTIRQRTAVELSQGAIVASRKWFARANGDVMQHLHVVRNDSRRYLKTTDRHYDVIIGDVFHPDLVGRSALLSLEHFQLVRDRLAEQGVFVQWLALNQFDLQDLQVVMRTFQRVFPDNALFVDGFRMALLGRTDNRESLAKIQSRVTAALDGTKRDLATGGEGRWTWLGRYWGTIEVADGIVQSEWSPAIEYSLPRARYRGDMDLAALMNWLLRQRPAPEQAAGDIGLDRSAYDEFERAYMATGLAMRSWLETLQNRDGNAGKLLRFAYQANPRDRWVGMMLADRMLASIDQAQHMGMSRRQALLAILRVRPDHAETLRALWKLEEREGNTDQARLYWQRLRKIDPYDLDSRRAQYEMKQVAW